MHRTSLLLPGEEPRSEWTFDCFVSLGTLEQAVYWDKRLSDEIGTAADENRQITGSFGVPDRVAALVKRRQNGG